MKRLYQTIYDHLSVRLIGLLVRDFASKVQINID